jgi:hypothetical protein
MAEELFCEKHGPYPASAKGCPHCAMERGGLPPAPASLGNNDEYTQGPAAASPGYSDDDETILPGQRGKRGNTVTSGRGGNDADETVPPAQNSRGVAWDDNEKTQLPKHGRGRILDPQDDPEDRTVLYTAKAQAGLMGWLIVKSSPYFQRGKFIRVKPDTIFGRSTSKADIPIDDEKVSARHAYIQVKDDKFYVVNMSTSNGTFVNGTQITGEVEIQQDDEITMGDTVFVLKTLK